MTGPDGSSGAGGMPSVREVEAGDAAAVATLQARSWRAAYRGIVPDPFLDDLADDAWLDRWTDLLGRPPRDGVHRLVSCRRGDAEPVAVAGGGPAVEPSVGATAQLHLLYADPDAWGEGHGSALLRAIHARLASDGHSGALLWVAAANERTIAIYEHLGWVLDGTTKRDDVAGTTIDQARMVRDLRD